VSILGEWYEMASVRILNTHPRVRRARRFGSVESRSTLSDVAGKPLLAALEQALSGCADHVGHLEGRPWHLLRTATRIAAPRKRQRVEGARDGLQVLLRKVEINGSLLQIAMPQQDLDGP
jgi:hypothetical protein